MKQFQKYLPDHWNEWIREFSLAQSEGKYEELDAGTFRGNLRLIFDDGSHAFFEGAFHIEDEARGEVAVFTEHCGYHIFSSLSLRVEYYEWTDPKFTFSSGNNDQSNRVGEQEDGGNQIQR